MDLEEHSVDQIQESCQRCGAKLSNGELTAALDSDEDIFLCTLCSAEELPADAEEQFE